MSLIFFRRKQPASTNSIGALFDTVHEQIADKIQCDNYTLPYPSTGIRNRIKNMWYAWQNKGRINHITGDVHYLAIVLPRKSTILTIHDCGELQNQTGIKRFILWFFWYYWPVRRLKYITVVSEATKKSLLKHVKTDEKKIRIIHNGLIGTYRKKSNPFNVIKPRILQIGNTPNKNLNRIISALENINCKLVILGKPNDEQLYLLKSKNIDYTINYNLSRNEVVDLYHSCDLLLYPSTIEGFGLPIIEAQASALPVITSNISSMPEIAGDGACFVNPFSVDSIREGVVKVINNEKYRNGLIEKGFANIKKFTSEAMANGYLKLYNEISTNN